MSFKLNNSVNNSIKVCIGLHKTVCLHYKFNSYFDSNYYINT